MYNHLLFDADGTLYDFEKAQEFALSSLFNELGLGASSTTLHTYNDVNQSLWKMFETGLITLPELKIERFKRFFTIMGLQTDPFEASLRYLEFLGKSDHIYQWTVPLLTSLRSKGYRISLITNGIASVQRGRLAATHTIHLYDHIYISEELGIQKPDPEFFSHVFPDESEKKRALIIGDSLSSDIAGGNAANIDTCWFNPSKETPRMAIPTYEINSMDELPTLLARLNQRFQLIQHQK